MESFRVESYRTQFYLDPVAEVSASALSQAEQQACEALRRVEGMQHCFTHTDLRAGRFPPGEIGAFLAHDFDARRSANLILVPKPYYFVEEAVERIISNHGTPHDYDRHVVMMMGGHRVAPGLRDQVTTAASVAPTLAKLLGLPDALAAQHFHAQREHGSQSSD